VVNVTNKVPTATLTSPATVHEGDAFTLALTNPQDVSADMAGLQYRFDCGVGYGAWGASSSRSCPATDNGMINVAAQIRDADGGVSPYSGTVQVMNLAPTATLGAPGTVAEGSPFVLALTGAQDVAADLPGLQYRFDCGTGFGAWGTLSSRSCPTTDNGTPNVAAEVRDKDGGVSNYTGTAHVSNEAPDVGPVTAPLDPIAVGTNLTVGASLTDPGTGDTHTVTVQWGDGQTSTASVASGVITGTHGYSAAGVYTVTIVATDDDGGSDASSYNFVVVYDRNGGFVTGGGWIQSQPGWCRLNAVCTTAAGKATLGFVSKFRPGANLPTGDTEFEFRVGGLRFESTAYEWLVVAGPRAQFKGTGRINAAGDYGFLLSATDGQVNGGGGVDRFRIKIWDRATGVVVYDNQYGDSADAPAATALGGGSIVIHK
jgi:hypothetical protein